MFGKPTNPYDEIINKATDEKQTEINWEIALSVWDKVNEDGETGARNSVNALTKRLTHRSANVQLFTLTLAGALVNNCGPSLHREISGKAFTQALTRLINDRTTHESVKKEALKSIEEWVKEHPNNSDFDLLSDTYESLKRQNHKFPSTITRNPTPPRINDEALRREEEDLQRALAESAALSNPLRGFQPSSSQQQQHYQGNSDSSAAAAKSLPSEPLTKPTRVQALYDFVGQSIEELEFKRGDVIRVTECLYEDWWKGENLNQRGRIGIFPRNHVQPLPEEEEPRSQPPSSSSQPLSEEDLEAEVFGQVALVDRLLALMHQLRERGQDFADNDELTDLYNSSMRLRPRVVKLIRKYDQKQADLVNMNRKVDQARGIYEGMMQPRAQPQPQALPPHGYPQPQSNGYHSHPTHQAEPYRTFSPASSAPHAARNVLQAQQQQVPPPAQTGGGIDPAIEEQQRREYEQKWAEYERQMEEYNRQLAAHQQYYQQQQGGGVPGQTSEQAPYGVSDPSAAAANPTDPHSYAAPTSQAHSGGPPPPPSHHHPSTSSPAPSVSHPQQPQPVWDGQAWVWPTRVAQVNSPPPPLPTSSTTVPYPGSSLSTPAHSPSLSHQHQNTGGGGGGVGSPLPNMTIYSSPPPNATTTPSQQQPQHSAMVMGGLTESIAAMGLNRPEQQSGGGGGGGQQYYSPQSGEDPAQAQWAQNGGANWHSGGVHPQ